MTDIPRIIHQTWKTPDLPPPFDMLAQTWKDAHPDWEYKLWTDEMNRDFISANFPGFLDKYDHYPKTIQRVDAFRYFLLLQEGGVYIDLDFECLENIAPLLAKAHCVIGKEPLPHSKRFSKEMILCNAFMAATPGHDFLHFVCNKIAAYPLKPVETPIDVMESTGPFILTDAYLEYPDKEAIRVLEPQTIYPLTMPEARAVFEDKITADMQERIDRAFAVHYFWGGW